MRWLFWQSLLLYAIPACLLGAAIGAWYVRRGMRRVTRTVSEPVVGAGSAAASGRWAAGSVSAASTSTLGSSDTATPRTLPAPPAAGSVSLSADTTRTADADAADTAEASASAAASSPSAGSPERRPGELPARVRPAGSSAPSSTAASSAPAAADSQPAEEARADLAGTTGEGAGTPAGEHPPTSTGADAAGELARLRVALEAARAEQAAAVAARDEAAALARRRGEELERVSAELASARVAGAAAPAPTAQSAVGSAPTADVDVAWRRRVEQSEREVTQLRAGLDRARADHERRADEWRNRAERAEGDVATARAERDRARAEHLRAVDDWRARAERAEQSLTALRADQERLRATHTDALARLEAAPEQQRAATEEAVARVRELADRAAGDAEVQLRMFRQRAERAESELGQQRGERDRILVNHERALAELRRRAERAEQLVALAAPRAASGATSTTAALPAETRSATSPVHSADAAPAATPVAGTAHAVNPATATSVGAASVGAPASRAVSPREVDDLRAAVARLTARSEAAEADARVAREAVRAAEVRAARARAEATAASPAAADAVHGDDSAALAAVRPLLTPPSPPTGDATPSSADADEVSRLRAELESARRGEQAASEARQHAEREVGRLRGELEHHTAEPDDLERIEGVGPKLAQALYAAGIRTFGQLRDAPEPRLRSAVERAGLASAPSLPTWSKQAAYLAAGDEDRFRRYTEYLIAGRDPSQWADPAPTPLGTAASTTSASSATADAAAQSAPATGGGADDLELIEGVGPKIASALRAADLHTFTSVAEASDQVLREALARAHLAFAPSLSTWSAQAAFLAAGDRAGFQRYVDHLIAGRDPGPTSGGAR